MRPLNIAFFICILLLMVSFFQPAAAAEVDSSNQNQLDQFISATIRVLFAITVIISIIAFTVFSIVSILPWWILILTAPLLIAICYFAFKVIWLALREKRIGSKISYELSKITPKGLKYESQFLGRAAAYSKRIPDLSHYLTPGYAINWMLGDVEKGKISWQLFTMGALVTLGTSIGIIILLFGHLSF